ncbi:hypothetical protein AB6A40_003089 [Gnathostoma spinigerum]|uniref:Uncharacterized protein n=1 Tax=Gnathostoma spinigerum TaxID=75299 RepID=A0ABD6EJB7_9BILA
MASRVNVCRVDVLDNPAKFGDPFKLEITFEAFEPLPDDLDWELVYVGSSESESYDQVLDSVLVGPVIEGRHKFLFEADGPDPSKIPQSEIVGMTVLLLRCRYRDQEFIKIGWFVSNTYTDPDLQENPPSTPILDQLTRTVYTDDVRVTTFAIKWDDNQEIPGDEVLKECESQPTTSFPDDNNLITTMQDNVMECSDVKLAAQQEKQTSELRNDLSAVHLDEKFVSDTEMDVNGQPLADKTNESLPQLVDA